MRLDGVRRSNLGNILRLVHRQGRLSRAQITARTGLNRSTVAELVGVLARDGLVEEGEPNPTRRVGRPSPSVSPSASVVAIAVNPEVDAIEVSAVTLGGRVLRRVRSLVESIPSPDQTVDIVEEIVQQWRARELATARIAGMGVAIPGLVDERDGVVRLAPHLAWQDVNIGGELAQRLGLPVTVGNDARFGALAEWLFGAARGHEHVLYLNGGASGIGGSLILHDLPISGAQGYAGEWGKNVVTADRTLLRTSEGILESEVNRARLVRLVGLLAPSDQELERALLAHREQSAAEVERQQRILASALGGAINALNPSIVVLGGFLSILYHANPAGLTEFIARSALRESVAEVALRAAALEDDRFHIGAAEAVFTPLFSDPLSWVRSNQGPD